MAAPPPANPRIEALQVSEIANGCEFSIALANTAPRPASCAPAPPNVNAWNGVPPVINAHQVALANLHPVCHDRPLHHGPPRVIPPGANLCSSIYNPPPPPVGANPHRRRRCVDASHAGAAFRICTYCIGSAQNQPWFQTIQDDVNNRISTIPTQNQQQPTATWRQFLTYLCEKCEEYEKKLWREHATTNNLPPNTHLMIGPGRGNAQTTNPPWNTCM